MDTIVLVMAGQFPSFVMQRWEYKTVDNTKGWVVSKVDKDPEDKLNELGDQGWELVGTIEGPFAGESSKKTRNRRTNSQRKTSTTSTEK